MSDVLYIHGFNSSPQSLKAELTKEYLINNHPSIDFHCPQLANTPLAAIAQLEEILRVNPDGQWSLIGSSLGGYFSTYLAEKFAIPAVLINPAVRPFELLADYIGEQVNPYTNEVYRVEAEHIEHLKSLEHKKLTKNLYKIMVQTGDEVLDYRQAVEKYQGCQLVVQQGGDHGFLDYEKCLPDIANFLQWQ